MAIFKPQIFSSHAMRLHIRLTKFLLTPLPALFCLFYRRVNTPKIALEVESLCLPEISINVNMLFKLLLFMYFVYVCFFTCLSLFYTGFYWYIFIYIHVNKFIIFVFEAFVYNLNDVKAKHHFRNIAAHLSVIVPNRLIIPI